MSVELDDEAAQDFFLLLSSANIERIARHAKVSPVTVIGVLNLRARAAYRREQARLAQRQSSTAATEEKRLLSHATATYEGERDVVYFLQAEERGRIKIGVTKNLEQRIRVLRAGSPVRLNIIGLVRGGRHMERMLHVAFAPLRCGRTEWFEPGESLLSYVRELQRPIENEMLGQGDPAQTGRTGR